MSAKRQTATARTTVALLVATLTVARTTPIEAQGATRLLVVTLDGMRWQEIFEGADRDLIVGEAGGVSDTTATLARFWRADRSERRRALMPFLAGRVATEGILLGDSAGGSPIRVTNGRRFSYPGYNELFTGAPDDRIDSNRKIANPNITVLEWLAGLPAFRGRIEVFGSWDVFPFIFNTARSRLTVNGEGLPFPAPADRTEIALNQMTEWLPALWASARLDAPTMIAAATALTAREPRVLTVLLGETDEWAHDRRYDQYLDAAHRADRFIEHLWNTAQSLPGHRGNTHLLISTDHGRGSGKDWTDHGEEVAAADRIWIGVLGPKVIATAVTRTQRATQSQFAATLAMLLGEDWQTARQAAAPPLRIVP